jgi:hypothetical protein
MEAALGPVVSALLKMGAPWIIVAVFVVLFMAERKRKDELADKLYDLGLAMTKTNTEVHGTLQLVQKDLELIKDHRRSR